MFTREGIIADVQNAVKVQLEKNGFMLDAENQHNKYIKCYDWGYDYCFLPHVRFQPEHILFSLTVHRRIDFVEKIWQEWSNLVNVNIEDPNDITTLYITEKNAYPEIINEEYYDGYGSFIFEISEKGLQTINEIVDNIFNEKIVFKLQELRDLKTVDKFINSDLDSPQNVNEIFNVDGAFMFKRMIFAKITGNGIYDDICKLFKSRFNKIDEIAKTPGKEYFLNYPIVFEKVYERLKNIEPLKNTVLSEKTA
ncbi:hypothetical protein [Fluviicola taffensis]|jgi:hypothetical protein|uniref:DUF4304 domain-containing protein n=1 Tax=Fluviicola taffensis (strain DSM 16823 / NCIMB 13979 / RW262) TaxID=755732 RepID=F2IDH4_FLUTR|nr:hypothetical protein [Fluviicola taffensis]AEA42350.1 hypothetical protein Fluta_0342 [Fluviicola taffensis DSM 16823]